MIDQVDVVAEDAVIVTVAVEAAVEEEDVAAAAVGAAVVDQATPDSMFKTPKHSHHCNEMTEPSLISWIERCGMGIPRSHDGVEENLHSRF